MDHPELPEVSANIYLPPQSPKRKFWLATEDTFDYANFILVGVLSGQSMAANSQPSFEQSWSGYSEYYWHSFADGGKLYGGGDRTLLNEGGPALLHARGSSSEPDTP